MREYPKAMYLGTKKKRQKLTHAKDYDHEQVLRGKGFLPYVELPDDDGASQPQTGATGGGDCAELREKWNDVGAVSARLHELTAGVDVYQPVAEPILDPSNLNPMAEPVLDPAIWGDVAYESWTVRQLRDELEKRGVTASRGANKAELIDLLKQLVQQD